MASSQEAELYELLEKIIHASLLCRHARATELVGHAAEKARYSQPRDGKDKNEEEVASNVSS